MELHIFSTHGEPVAEQPVEYVERKGLGHPDSICDAVMEAAATALRREYLDRCGRVLHHNLDKALLVAGQSEPRLRGGRVVSPIQIIAGDRATASAGGLSVPVDEIVEAAVRKWIRDNLRFVDADQHVAFRSEIQPGSAELTAIFERQSPVANDTSAAVGFAPLSETERLVLETEQLINSGAFKERFMVAGEDVKVMAVRHEKKLQLTVAVAMVDRFVPTASSYFEQKEEIRTAIVRYVHERCRRIEEITVDINKLDQSERGLAGMYLTVLGTSAESGDGGEVGRGNSVNGLISLNRPTSNEAAAGKNTVCHVGNIYSHLSHKIAGAIVDSIEPVQEAYVWLCGQIGRPIDNPWSAAVRVSLEPGVEPNDVRDEINAIAREHLRQAARTFNPVSPSAANQ